MSWLRTITVRQTRNYLATDVEYIASKRITLPEPRGRVPSTTPSKLGFGTHTQKFFAVSFGGSVDPGPWKSRKLPLAALREILVYDEEFGGSTLTIIAVEEWHRNCRKELKRTARIAPLFTLPHYISASQFSEDSASAFEVSIEET